MDATLSLVLFEAVLILLAIAISKAIRLISPLDDRCSCKDVVDSIPTVSSPSHIVAAPTATKYDVFLSFRGEDTRDTFSSSLYEALCNASIHTFMDHRLYKGQDIAPVLLKTIEESEISLIIFSKDYASSTWCMDELVHIMKCRDKYGRIVIPIFYHLDPSSIRKQNGSFGDGFANLKFRFQHNNKKVQEWENALVQSTKLSGWDSKNIRPESELIKKIVEDILNKLNTKSSFHDEGLVGRYHQIQEIEDLLSEARIVGIWGMGGIGKTTLASVVFQKLKEQFEAFSFVGNVREQLARIGLEELQKKCLQELLKDEGVNAYNFKSTFVKRRLHRKKILLILDDVDNSIAIEDLTKVCYWFGEGSRIIITSRDMQVLKNTFASIRTYHVPRLDSHQAIHLFSLKAFKQNESSKSFLELSEWVVDYCEGNPLALIVLGCFLYGRGKEEWESTMKKLNQNLHKDIFNVLKLSFDGLDDTQQNVFLDLAFFLNEDWRISPEDFARRIYDSSALIDIGVLKERSLISINEFGNIEMHALLIDMGLEISRQQLSNPEKPIRLWRHDDIYHFFHHDKGTKAIRCLSWDLSKIRRTTWSVSNFLKMRNLMFFKVHKSDERKASELIICDNLDYLPEELRYFIWEEYPFPQVPLHFCSENLIELNMPNSNMRQLWNENQHFPNLERIILWGSKHLTVLPDLSHAPKISFLSLSGCVKLDQIHSSTILGNLASLYVTDNGPRRINIGGRIKGTMSGVVVVYNYLDFRRLSLIKVRVKVLVCSDIICGLGFKYVEMSLADKTELSYLLPFVRGVHFLEDPIEYGHDFWEFYDCKYTCHYFIGFIMGVRRRDDRGGKRHVVGPFTKEMINDRQTSMEARGGGEGEGGEVEEGEEELMREYYCGGSNSSSNATIFIRVPSSITRWSLLTGLRLRKNDMVEDSILKSLSLSFSHASCKPHFDATLALHIPPSAWTDHNHHHDFTLPHVNFGGLSYGLYPNYIFGVWYLQL